MSGNFHADSQNFSFTSPPFDESTWFSVNKPETSLRFFYFAVGASLAIHFIVALWLPFKRITSAPVDYPKTIHLELQYSIALESAPVEEAPVKTAAPVLQDIPEAIKEAEHIIENPEDDVMPMAIENTGLIDASMEPEVLDEAGLQTMIQSANYYRDSYLETDSSSDLTVNFPGRGSFGNVFDPRIRARLQNNRTPARANPPSPGSTTTSTHGETFVGLEGGACMMERETRIGEPTNWYITKCPDYEDESERMMERVNQAIKNRRRQPVSR